MRLNRGMPKTITMTHGILKSFVNCMNAYFTWSGFIEWLWRQINCSAKWKIWIVNCWFRIATLMIFTLWLCIWHYLSFVLLLLRCLFAVSILNSWLCVAVFFFFAYAIFVIFNWYYCSSFTILIVRFFFAWLCEYVQA